MATGVSLVEGLQDIESQLTKQKLKRVVAAVRRDIESGESLSTALSRHPKVFGDLYVNIVRAGEATGKIDQALDDLVAQLEWQAELNSRIREVATYPVLVVFMLGVLSVVLVGFTIPRFLQVYERLNAQIELPLPTRIVMTASALMRTYWPVILTTVIAVVVSLRLWGQTAAERCTSRARHSAFPSSASSGGRSRSRDSRATSRRCTARGSRWRRRSRWSAV